MYSAQTQPGILSGMDTKILSPYLTAQVRSDVLLVGACRGSLGSFVAKTFPKSGELGRGGSRVVCPATCAYEFARQVSNRFLKTLKAT